MQQERNHFVFPLALLARSWVVPRTLVLVMKLAVVYFFLPASLPHKVSLSQDMGPFRSATDYTHSVCLHPSP